MLPRTRRYGGSDPLRRASAECRLTVPALDEKTAGFQQLHAQEWIGLVEIVGRRDNLHDQLRGERQRRRLRLRPRQRRCGGSVQLLGDGGEGAVRTCAGAAPDLAVCQSPITACAGQGLEEFFESHHCSPVDLMKGRILGTLRLFPLIPKQISGLDLRPADSSLAVVAQHPVLPESRPDAIAHVVAVRTKHEFLADHL